MSVTSAVEKRESSMPRLLSSAKQELTFLLRALRLRLKRRIPFRAERLQTECARGRDIAEFQRRFNQFAERRDIQITVSGVYDEETRRGVACFQKHALYVIDADGYVGPQTARLLHIKLTGE